MHIPTAAERKTILSKLPPALEGKVWTRLTKGKMKAGDHLFIEGHGMVHIGKVRVGAPFDGAPTSKLEHYQSAWRLVATRKRPAKARYYRPKVSTPCWAVKNDGATYFEYNNNSFCDGYVQKPVAESAMYVVEEGLERGTDIEIDRNEFLGLIKSFGLNEDGTKIVSPDTELERLKEENLRLRAIIAASQKELGKA